MSDDEEDEFLGGLYEDGHWVWSETEMGLVFVSDKRIQEQSDRQMLITKVPTGTIEFRDDLDLLEQMRFRRRYQRKLLPGQADIITLQDVKDLALYTAPVNILSPALINMLHLSTTERFIRTLIFFCQYYLQVEEQMALRNLETESMIRTPDCEVIERQFRNNLADLRLLVAKEYSLMIIGAGDMKQFHHMGPTKKRKSLSDKDARLFETLFRMCVQIVWLALGRKSFNQIELEVNRIFKSEIFNAVEHRLKTSYIAKMTKEQRSVLLGHCVRHDGKLVSRSPLLNELCCERPIDYRLLGLGIIKYPNITLRMRYMMLATAGPEDILCENGVVLGIIGLPRSGFDTMLQPVYVPDTSKSRGSMSMTAKSAVYSRSNASSFSKSSNVKKLYPEVEIPPKDEKEILIHPPSFSEEPEIPRHCSHTQKVRWQKRLARLLNPQSTTRLSRYLPEKMSDDEDEGGFGGMYENGHWAWDDNEMGIIFVREDLLAQMTTIPTLGWACIMGTNVINSDLAPQVQEDFQISSKVPTGTIEFRDDVDLIEQIRFRRRYQRKLKPGQADIITLQDVKDIALYTAPVNILSPALINMLHLSTTERFIRALILFCQYYLQVEQEMSLRILELQTKMRTPYCNVIEKEFADNLSDLRLLIAKEYCTMLIGGGDTKKFHHMGSAKKRRSLSDKDARLFETLLRMCVQIVWLALGRKSFNQIELEVNRIFKSEIFNRAEHTLKTRYIAKMSDEERSVLLGQCDRHGRKLNTCSPLMTEVSCDRPIDYRLFGLGVIRYKSLPTRLNYMMLVAAGPEDILCEHKVVLGIIGLPRSGFDTMLRPVSTGTGTESESKSTPSMFGGSAIKSRGSVKKSQIAVIKLYPDIVIPRQNKTEELLPPAFPNEPEVPKLSSETQRRRWQKRLQRLLHPQAISHISSC